MTGRPELELWAAVYRLVVPIAVGALAAGWLVARTHQSPTSRAVDLHGPPWRPWLGVVGNLAAFILALAIAWSTFGPGASPVVPSWTLPALLGLGAAAVVFAATTAGPLSWLVGRTRGLATAFPLMLVLGLLTWWVTITVEGAWGLLSSATLRTVGWLLRLTGGDVLVIPAELAVGVDGFEVEIAPVCSGVEGIGLIVLFESIWLALARNRLRFLRALLLLPLGAAAAFLANALRIATLVRVGASGPEAIALGGLHSKLGWILSVAIALGSVALAERAGWLHRPDAPGSLTRATDGVPANAGAYLGPLLAALGTALVTGIWAHGGLDRWYGARIAAAAAVLGAVRRSLPPLLPSLSWLPTLVGSAVAAVWIAASAGDGSSLAQAVGAMGAGQRAAWIGVRIVGSVMVIPLAEELAFRGLLLPWIVSPNVESVSPRAWTWPAVLLSSIAFGALHPQFLLGTAAGLAFAFARLWRGRLGDAVVAHAVANAGLAVAVIFGGRWSLWS